MESIEHPSWQLHQKVRSVMFGEEKACVVIHGKRLVLSRKGSIFQKVHRHLKGVHILSTQYLLKINHFAKTIAVGLWRHNFLFLLCGAMSSSVSSVRDSAICTQLARATCVILTLINMYFMNSQREGKKLFLADTSVTHCRSSTII